MSIMNNTIRINSGIKKYAIQNERDEVVAELIIDSNDDSLMTRFIDLMEKSQEIYKRYSTETEKISISEEITVSEARRILDINSAAVNELIEETEKMFGDGLIHDIPPEMFSIIIAEKHPKCNKPPIPMEGQRGSGVPDGDSAAG